MSNFFPSPSGFIQPQLLFGRGVWLPIFVPDGARYLTYTLCGAGGPGGNGFSGAALSARGGGGGGGSGAQAAGLLVLAALPQVLYLRLGDSGSVSALTIQPEAAQSNRHLIASVNSGGTGGNGTAAAAGAAGTGGSVNVATVPGNTILNQVRTTGDAGIIGGIHTGAVGGNNTLSGKQLNVSGGASGAGVGTSGVEFAGGSLAFGTPAYQPSGTILGGLLSGGDGGDGLRILHPYPLFTGGAGGGSSNAGVGGKGGEGAPGCGGGGGAGGVTGGLGGRGGPAWAYLVWS